MSLLTKLTAKLEAISKEEEEDYENLLHDLEKKNANVKKKKKVKKMNTKLEEKSNESEWEDLDEDIIPSKEKIDNKIKRKPTPDPLFPNDVASPPETPEKKLELKTKETSNMEGKQEKNYYSLNLTSNAMLRELQQSDGFVEAKIVELSKKIRELNAQLISTQNKLRIAENLVASQETVQKETEPVKEITKDQITKYETEIKELNDKYQACNAKLCESRNLIQQHKHEIKILHKALASEVGDNYSIHSVTSEGWRGRAQQIFSLQQKVVELSEKLSLTSIPSIEKTVSAVQSYEKSQDKERIVALTKEVEELQTQLNDVKNKGDQARARVNVLTGDIAVLKSKYETLVVKNEEDVKLINTLTTKLTSVSQKNHDRELHLVKKYDDQLAALNTELKQERVKTDQYQKIISERDIRIKKLEEKIQECYQNYSQASLMRNEPGYNRPQTSGVCSERPTTQQSVVSNSTYSQSIEVERLRLMELITVLNKRLDEERKNLDKVQDNLRIEKQKTAKLESKVNKLELEKVGKNYKRPTGRPESLSKFDLESMKDQCALLKEKCLAQESRLERLRQEKEEDSRIYVRMVEEARAALRDYIRKTSTCSNSS